MFGIISQSVSLYITMSFTDLCFVLHLLCVGVCARGGERLQKATYPGPGALCLSIQLFTSALQGGLGVRLLLQPGLQVSVALYQVISVLQEAFSSDALPAY